MYDIDIVWHSHIVNPSKYFTDMQSILGYVMNHDDTDQERTPGSKLSSVSVILSSVEFLRALGSQSGVSV